MRVALAATHPIEYQAPWFRGLAARPELELEVGFAWLPDAAAQGVGFDVPFAWDLPLRDGYRSVELPRRGTRPRLSTFTGLRLREPARWLSGRFDAVVVTGWHSWALLQTARAARRLGLPVIVRGDSRGGLRRPLPVRLAHRLILRLFAAFLVVGSRNRDFYRGYGVPPSRLFDCPHFVDNERFADAAARARPDREALRARFGLRPEAIVALFAGKLQPVKSLDLLLAAVERSRRAVSDLELLVVGDGVERTSLERRVRERTLPVSFAGFLNQREMPSAYAAADVLILPSRSETWGLVVNEAMACGLPAIVSDAVGCAPDLVDDGETGWTFPSGDCDALVARLLDASTRRSELPGLGESARRRLVAGYSVERAVEGTLAALAAVGAGASRAEGAARSAT